MARDRGNPAIQSQILIYPVTDFDFSTDSYRENGDGSYGLSEIGMRWFWDCYVHTTAEGREPYASPLRSTNLSGLPKAMVITAEYDPLRDEAEAYAKRLEQSNIPTQLMRYDGVTHGFVSQAAHIPEGRAALEWIGEEIRTTL
jgi:acetyl esterase